MGGVFGKREPAKSVRWRLGGGDWEEGEYGLKGGLTPIVVEKGLESRQFVL